MWVTVAAYLLSLLLSVWGIQFHINLFRHPIYFLAPVLVAVFIPVSMLFLVPLDYVKHNSDHVWFSLPDSVILTLWKVKYWVTFLLTWLVLPLLQEFYKSGHYRKYDKLADAFKKNVRFQLIMLGISALGGVYLLMEAGLSFGHMKLMIIALSHIYSLGLALWLMAHGLVNIPRNKWTFGNLQTNLNFYYLKVPKLIDDLEDCKIAFKEDILQVIILYKSVTNDLRYRDWVYELYNSIPDDLKDLMELQYTGQPAGTITEESMTKLSSRFNSNLFKLIAYESEFKEIFAHILLLEDVTTTSSANPVFRTEGSLAPKWRFLYYYYINPILNRLYAIILFIMAAIVIESELFHSTKLSLINVIFTRVKHSLVQFLVCCIIFAFMLICSLNSLTKLKVFNMYHLVAHNSAPSSACFYSTYIARLTIPLSYNFITLFVSRLSVFEDWFGKSIHLTGFFNFLNNWIPRLVLLPIILAVFNVYDKLKRRLGLTSDLYDTFAFDDAIDGETDTLTHKRKDMIIVEAKRIITREYNKTQSRPFPRQDRFDHRPFNLQAVDLANINYENNRAMFEQSLMGNRIDYDEYRAPESLWSRLGSRISGWRDSWRDRPVYRDEPLEPLELDGFAYDEDADDTLVL